MVAPLEHVLVQHPTGAFESAFDDPAHGYLHPVESESARKEHEEFCELLTSLDVIVHQLDGDFSSPDLIYTYDAYGGDILWLRDGSVAVGRSLRTNQARH